MEHTIDSFITQHGITMTCQWADRNPNMTDGTAPMDHWRCTLRMGRRRMTLTFSMGVGHAGREPNVRRVLDTLAMDAAGVDGDFDDWCREYGYDTDSRSALRTFNACVRQRSALLRFLGPEPFETLLWRTERA